MTMTVSAGAAMAATDTVSGASRGAPPQQKMSMLFDSIDTSGAGTISKAQFQQAFQTSNPPAVFRQQGANAVFSALDPGRTGSVSRQDFVSGMSGLMASLREAAPATSATQGSTGVSASLQARNQIDPASLPAGTPPGSGPPGSVLDISS